MYKKSDDYTQKIKEVEAPTVLPQADFIRLPVVEMCLAGLVQKDEKDPKKDINRANCNKVFTHPDGTQVCISYRDPSILWKNGCGLASNKINIADEKKKIRVGQQKQRRNF
jgi:hypothetical protein